ncbi:hypothetical protein NKJ51_23765 [Mesorhizobium sp. M0134]|uniref:hypothetical protein n=1 Tax=Mesorhizobium sp. M0134 TaxID=2956889 RepID=UPI00333D927C
MGIREAQAATSLVLFRAPFRWRALSLSGGQLMFNGRVIRRIILKVALASEIAGWPTIGYATTRVRDVHEIQISSSLLRSLMPRKLFFGEMVRTYAIYCSMEHSRKVDLKHGCANIGVLQYYVNKKKADTIDLAIAYEFSRPAYSVIFGPSDFRFPFLQGRVETKHLQNGCDQKKLYDKNGLAFLVHISEKVRNVDACLFHGLFAYLGFEIPGDPKDLSLEEAYFIYDFIASPKTDYEASVDYARAEASREDVVVKIVD